MKQEINDSKSWEQAQYKELMEDLKKIDTIYVVGLRQSNNPNWDKGIWRYFGVYYIKNNKLERVFIYTSLKKSQKPSYWNHETNCFECIALGTDRTHEIIYSLYQKVYPFNLKDPKNDALYKMPKIQFLSYFDGNSDDYDEREEQEGDQ